MLESVVPNQHHVAHRRDQSWEEQSAGCHPASHSCQDSKSIAVLHLTESLPPLAIVHVLAT